MDSRRSSALPTALAASVLSAPLLVLACGDLLDVDAYDLARRDAGPTAEDADTANADVRGAADAPSEHQTGTIYVAECQACLDDRCSQQLASCQGDAACASLLECIKKCSDPGCVTRCAAPDYGPLTGWPIENVEECLKASCLHACPIGETYDCDDYAWAAVYDRDESVALRAKVFDLAVGVTAGVPGVQVTPCLSSDFAEACLGNLEPRTTDGDGWVTFTLPVSSAGFDGYFTAQDPELPGVTYRYFRDMPFNDYWDLNQLPVDRSGIAQEIYTAQTGRTFGSDVGAIFFELYDCNTWPAHDLLLDVEPLGEDVWTFYPSLAGRTVGEGRRNDAGDVLPSANFVAVVAPPGAYTFTFTHEPSGTVMHRASLDVLSAHFDVRVLSPK